MPPANKIRILPCFSPFWYSPRYSRPSANSATPLPAVGRVRVLHSHVHAHVAGRACVHGCSVCVCVCVRWSNTNVPALWFHSRTIPSNTRTHGHTDAWTPGWHSWPALAGCFAPPGTACKYVANRDMIRGRFWQALHTAGSGRRCTLLVLRTTQAYRASYRRATARCTHRHLQNSSCQSRACDRFATTMAMSVARRGFSKHTQISVRHITTPVQGWVGRGSKHAL